MSTRKGALAAFREMAKGLLNELSWKADALVMLITNLAGSAELTNGNVALGTKLRFVSKVHEEARFIEFHIVLMSFSRIVDFITTSVI